MQTANPTGQTSGTTRDASNGQNSDDCALCDRQADGLDAVSGKPVCEDCAAILQATRDDDCPHSRVRRYGRTDATGEAVIERRCADCGRTLSLGGER